MKAPHHAPISRSVRTLALLALTALTTFGCIRAEIAITVNEDGSGVLEYTVALSDAFLGLAEATGDDSFSVQDEDLPSGAEVREYSEGGYSGFIASVPFTDYAELRDLLEESQTEFVEGVATSGIPDISQDEDGAWRFSMLVPPLGEELFEDGSTEDAQFAEQYARALLADAWYRVRVGLPGEIEEHNADRLEDGELFWELDFFSTEPRRLTALTTPGGGLPLAAVGVPAAVVVVIVLVAIAALTLTRRRSRDASNG